MNVLIVARGYPTDKYKMNGIFEFDQAKALAEAGNKVIYLALDTRSLRRPRKWGYESQVKDGVNIEAINIPVAGLPTNIVYKIREYALRKLWSRALKKHGKPDIIHAHFLWNGFVSVKVLEQTSIPLVLTEHWSRINQDELPAHLEKIAASTYHKVDKLIAVGTKFASRLEKNFQVETTIIPNIVDTSSFSYKNISRDQVFRFISTGSLKKIKGMDILIKAFNRAFGKNDIVELYIFGEGPERKDLEKLITELGLDDKVFLMGMRHRNEISETMHESHCFVLASKSETFGVAFIEAMAAGLPVIATECGGPEDFVDESNGILVPVRSESKLCSALQYMYHHIDKYNREAISKDIIQKFNSTRIAQKLIGEYNEVIKQKMQR